MKRFVFRLDFLLRLRREQEEGCQKELARTILLVEQARVSLERSMLARENLRREWRDRLNSNLGLTESASTYEACKTVQECRVRDAEQVEVKARTEEQLARLKLLKAARKRQILEKLRDRHVLSHREACLKAEQKLLDEVSANRFVRAPMGA